MPLTLKEQSAALTVGATSGTEVYGKSSYTKAGGGGASALDDLTDVVITSATTNDFLQYNGTNWVNGQNALWSTNAEARFSNSSNRIFGATNMMTIGAQNLLNITGSTARIGTNMVLEFRSSGIQFSSPTSAGQFQGDITTSWVQKINGTTKWTLNSSGVTMETTTPIMFNASTEAIYSSTSGQLDLTSGGLIKIHAVTEVRDVINTNTARSVTTSEHRWYISGNDNLYLDASVGSGKLGYYTGAVTTAYATWSSATWQLINANNSGIINITASGTSAEVNIQATSNLSVRIGGTSEYFVFSREAASSDYRSALHFYAYDDDSGSMAETGAVKGYSSFSGASLYFSLYHVVAGETFRINQSSQIVFWPSGTAPITFSQVALNSVTINGPTLIGFADTAFLYCGTSNGTAGFGCNGIGTCTINIKNNSSGTTTVNIGTSSNHTVNILASTEWSFTTTALTIGDANNIVLNTGTGTKFGTGTTQKMSWWNATPVVQSTGWGCSNVTTDKGLDCNSTTLDEVADVLGSLIDQLKTYGLLGA